jgi:uncharacterized surface protein with fasciclin (FAS1) repeats
MSPFHLRALPMRSLHSLLLLATSASLWACGGTADQAATQSSEATATASAGQANVDEGNSTPNIVKVAVGSADHTTLVAALKAANLVDVLANPGPFTVFAPVNAAFEKLPAGTVDNLLKPKNKSQLKEILQHHVTTSALDIDSFTDGQELGMVSAGSETIARRADGVYIGAAKIIASVRASNGWVHVIDGVLVPAK